MAGGQLGWSVLAWCVAPQSGSRVSASIGGGGLCWTVFTRDGDAAGGDGDLRTGLYPCGETQTMSHIVESCSLTKRNGSLSWLLSADGDAVSWLTSYGS